MKRFYILIFLLFILTACGDEEVTHKDLIGGTWVATAGYEDGEAKGEPNCYPFEEGSEFEDENTVYNTSYERKFDYNINEFDGGLMIEFEGPILYSYQIKKISENEIIIKGLKSGSFEDHSCYLERK